MVSPIDTLPAKTLKAREFHVDPTAPNRLTIGNVLAIDDDGMTLRALQGHAKRNGYRLQTADNAASGLQLIDETTAVALVNLRMPNINGFECLKYIRKHHPHVQVVILTGSSETDDAVEAMRAGAFQFVTKPFDPKQLLVYLAKACAASQAAVENRDLRESKSQNVPVRVPMVSGDANSRLLTQIARLSAVDSTVFIGGESGTGKSTVARMIHQQSSRRQGPFVSINCASLPRDLLTSELFGHTKGAFTGGVKDRVGHAEVADGGTLFLDEIGDLPFGLQPKLLTFLQDRTVQRLGSSEVRKVDVRLIVATHRDLAEMCREQAFRQDLYFRLMVLSIEIPPLRHRSAELPSMAEGILARICERMGTEPKRLSGDAIRRLLEHSWPGNIRELENVLERAMAFSSEPMVNAKDLLLTQVGLDRHNRFGDQEVLDPPPLASVPYPERTPQDLLTQSIPETDPVRVAVMSPRDSAESCPPSSPMSSYSLVGKTLDEIERDAIIQTLQACQGNKAQTARVLGISEKSIYNKMRRLAIDRSVAKSVREFMTTK